MQELLDKKNKIIINFNFTNVLKDIYKIKINEIINIHINDCEENIKFVTGTSIHYSNNNINESLPVTDIIKNFNFNCFRPGRLSHNFYIKNKNHNFWNEPYSFYKKTNPTLLSSYEEIDLITRYTLIDETKRSLINELINEIISKDTQIHFYGYGFGQADDYFTNFLFKAKVNIDKIKLYFPDDKEIIDNFISRINKAFSRFIFYEKSYNGVYSEEFSKDFNIENETDNWFGESILIWQNDKWINYSDYIDK